MCLRSKKDNNGFYLTCMGKPECNNVIWLADVIREIKVSENNCTRCGGTNKKVILKFKSLNSFMHLLNHTYLDDNNSYTSCILCDPNLRTVLDIQNANLRQSQSSINVPNSNASNHRPAVNRPSQTNNFVRPPTMQPTTYPNQRQNNNRPRLDNSNRDQSDRDVSTVKCPHCNQPAIK